MQEAADDAVAIEDRMRIRVRSARAIGAAALTIALAWSPRVFAAPQQLDCVLTDTQAHPGSEKRPIVVVFDTDAKTLTAKDGDHTYRFSQVLISNVTINGLDDSVSLGIDRSSLGIVWQQYAAGKATTEFGHCQAAPAPK